MQTLPRVVRLEAVIPEVNQQVFSFLLRVNETAGLHSTLRVAGGWVRDAILHLHSNDIDIAIESPAEAPVSGERFAVEVSKLQEAEGGRGRTVSVIRVNPALSKHIETATVCVCDLPVEFCALRTDDYCEDSRIPQVRPASPEEDARRRDFTINALFYNLHTGNIEDYTTGLEDLQQRVIRCPLEPRQTFTDDPLRLLRGVRFVGQLGPQSFHLDPAIVACVDDQLLAAVQHKVSRERIGKEFTKMLTGARPDMCVDLLLSMRLLQQVLLVEVYMKQKPGKKQLTAEIERTAALVDQVESADRALGQLSQLNHTVSVLFSDVDHPGVLLPSEDKLVAVLFELLIPFFRGHPAAAVEERVYALCLNGLKLPTPQYTSVRRMIDCYNALLRHGVLLQELQAPLGAPTILKLFDALGHLNDRCVAPHAFKIVLLTYLAVECLPDVLAREAVAELCDVFDVVWPAVEGHPNLLEAYSLTLPVKGNELPTLAGVEAKEIGAVLLALRRQMVLNPGLSREAAVAWVKARSSH